mmetsp:Transcript_77584/g.195138  ORF Transcript_77584/g.195138 Transcript_77584/m.195138 type:complete len:214 (+) Transcript_77584:116-757(+)
MNFASETPDVEVLRARRARLPDSMRHAPFQAWPWFPPVATSDMVPSAIIICIMDPSAAVRSKCSPAAENDAATAGTATRTSPVGSQAAAAWPACEKMVTLASSGKSTAARNATASAWRPTRVTATVPENGFPPMASGSLAPGARVQCHLPSLGFPPGHSKTTPEPVTRSKPSESQEVATTGPWAATPSKTKCFTSTGAGISSATDAAMSAPRP